MKKKGAGREVPPTAPKRTQALKIFQQNIRNSRPTVIEIAGKQLDRIGVRKRELS